MEALQEIKMFIEHRLAILKDARDDYPFDGLTKKDAETLLSIMPEWVKCSDRLPEEGHQVWTYFNEGMAFAIFTEGRFFEGGIFDGQEFNETVTHWMPLPKNPTE